MKKRIVITVVILIIVTLVIGCGKSAEVTNVENMINSLGEISLDSEKAIKDAEDAYKALTEKDKNQVNNVDILEDARKEIDRLVKKEKEAEEEAKKREEEAAEEQARQTKIDAYQACKEYCINNGTPITDEAFSETIYVVPVETSEGGLQYAIGAAYGDDSFWLFNEYIGTDPSIKGLEWSIDINGETGIYNINLPLTMGTEIHMVSIKGSFDLETYSSNSKYTAEEIVFVEDNYNIDLNQSGNEQLKEFLYSYPTNVIPVSVEWFNGWIDKSDINYTMKDLCIGIKEPPTEQVSNNSSSSSKPSSSSSHKTRTCPNCNGARMVRTYSTNNPWEEPTYIECPMCHGKGTVSD